VGGYPPERGGAAGDGDRGGGVDCIGDGRVCPEGACTQFLNRRKPEPGNLIYTMPLRYSIRFSDHSLDVPKIGAIITEESYPPFTLDIGGITMGAPPADVTAGVPDGSDVTSAETDDELQDGSGVSSAMAGTRGVHHNVHTGAVRNLGVGMTM
jgi:hypothetical protein